MRKMGKNGFTLIELLAIIIIMGIIAVIAVPTVKKLTEDAKKKAFINTARGIIKAGDLYYSRKDMLDEIDGDITFTFPDNAEELELQGKLPDNGKITINEDGDIELVIYNKNYCITKGFTDKDITITEDVETCEITEGSGNNSGNGGTGENNNTDNEGNSGNQGSGDNTDGTLYVDSILNGADPVLKTGMIPVVISADGTVTKADTTKEWYNYTNKQWANAVLVNNDSRENYKTMAAGEPISETDILAYFVWIPRYKYKLWYVEAADGAGTATDTSKVHSIDIVFENNETAKSDGTCDGEKEGPSNDCYLTHSAFTFGEEELNGIWVGKFETGYNGATTADEAKVEAIDSSKVIIKPNTYSWRYNTISNMFFTALYMTDENNIFGLTTNSDTHMIKNTEWGAVTYLAFSDYGKDSEVYRNNNSNYLTGCGADATDSDGSSNCLNGYGTKGNNEYNQSTTGNISGIFDMSGGAYEYVMGYARGATTTYGSSGFTAETFPDDKYVDIYTSTNSTDYSKRILGDATGEMGPFASYKGSWYGNYALFVDSSYPWFHRGGSCIGSAAGLARFSADSGVRRNDNSLRVVLA